MVCTCRCVFASAPLQVRESGHLRVCFSVYVGIVMHAFACVCVCGFMLV